MAMTTVERSASALISASYTRPTVCTDTAVPAIGNASDWTLSEWGRCAEAGPVYWGKPLPSWQGSASTTLTLWQNVRVYALVDFQGGHHRVNGDVAGSHLFFANSRCINERPICDPILAAYASLGEVWQTGTMEAGFAKLRNLSVTYTLPGSIVSRIGASRGTITVAGRNLARIWTADEAAFGHPITDPEIGKESSAVDSYNQELWPQFRTITTSIRLSF